MPESGPVLPKTKGEESREQEKEGAGDLEPNDAACTLEWTQEAPDAVTHHMPCLGCDLFRCLRGGLSLHHTAGGHIARARLGLMRAGGGSRLGREVLPRNTPGDPYSYSQGAADHAGSHTVYDGSSGPWRLAPPAAAPGLLLNGNRSKVERFQAATRALIPCGPPLMEVAVTSRLRELIQQLGEAIHESVIESEQIAGVVQDIRKHGFDVLLMLEATIGLNEVSAKENDAARTDEETGGKLSTFTPNDLHFLRSLRISVEGEPDESATDVK